MNTNIQNIITKITSIIMIAVLVVWFWTGNIQEVQSYSSCRQPVFAFDQGLEDRLLQEFYNYRRARGLSTPPEVYWNTERGSNTRLQALYERQVFSHNYWTSDIYNCGLRGTAGENLWHDGGLGQTDAKAIINAWHNSPGHYANLVRKDIRTVGVSCGIMPKFVGKNNVRVCVYIWNY